MAPRNCRYLTNERKLKGRYFFVYIEAPSFVQYDVSLTLLVLKSPSGAKPVKLQAVCPQNGTAVLKRQIRKRGGGARSLRAYDRSKV